MASPQGPRNKGSNSLGPEVVPTSAQNILFIEFRGWHHSSTRERQLTPKQVPSWLGRSLRVKTTSYVFGSSREGAPASDLWGWRGDRAALLMGPEHAGHLGPHGLPFRAPGLPDISASAALAARPHSFYSLHARGFRTPSLKASMGTELATARGEVIPWLPHLHVDPAGTGKDCPQSRRVQLLLEEPRREFLLTTRGRMVTPPPHRHNHTSDTSIPGSKRSLSLKAEDPN